MTMEKWVFVMAFNMQCYLVNNTVLHAAFYANLPAGIFIFGDECKKCKYLSDFKKEGKGGRGKSWESLRKKQQVCKEVFFSKIEI